MNAHVRILNGERIRILIRSQQRQSETPESTKPQTVLDVESQRSFSEEIGSNETQSQLLMMLPSMESLQIT